ncbi:MAG: hypothetical protein WBE96_22015, partial [Pseudolabrys sp.]
SGGLVTFGGFSHIIQSAKLLTIYARLLRKFTMRCVAVHHQQLVLRTKSSNAWLAAGSAGSP